MAADQEMMEFMAMLMARTFHKLGVNSVTLVDEDDQDVIEGKTLNFSIEFPTDGVTKVVASFDEPDDSVPDGLSLTAADKDGNKLYTERFGKDGHSTVELAPAGVYALAEDSFMDDEDNWEWEDAYGYEE